MQNFAKIVKLILFDRKCPNVDMWALIFKEIFRFKIKTFKIKDKQNFVKRLKR